MASPSLIGLYNVAERHRTSPYSMISVEKALEIILEYSSCLGTLHKYFEDSLGYVLAEDIVTNEPFPPFSASLKDGYAVLASDPLDVKTVVGVIYPGTNPEYEVVNGNCIRISTGCPIPKGCDAIVQVEDTEVVEKDDMGLIELKIRILKAPKVSQDIREIGSDINIGEIVLNANKQILPADIGIMATLGITSPLVYKKPWIALLSTGDEILHPTMPLIPGCIRDSNKSTLMSLLKENNIPFLDIGIAKDKAEDIKYHLDLAFEASDIVISSGGVSMGEKDILKQVLITDFNAVVHFGRIFMKPGKPTTFSTVDFKGKRKLVFSLPGNPVSAYVCFFLFIIPCIRKLMGFPNPRHKVIKVKLIHDFVLDERPEYHRVSLTRTVDNQYMAQSTGFQQSSRLASMLNADALLLLPPRMPNNHLLPSGTLVDAILLHSHMILNSNS